MTRRARALAIVLAWTAACGKTREEPPAAPATETTTEPAVEPAEPAERDDSVGVKRITVEPTISEVVLDPRGEAALTLARDGRVQLLDTLAKPDNAWRLPLQDPIWMTLARKGEAGGFVVAVVDTTNGGQVLELEPTSKPDEVRARLRFAIPPTEPLLELHVLDGGERVLALGVDHRLRLYDLEGRLLSEIDERGFAPWQLRLSGGDGTEPLHLAVTLAGPLRIQRVALDGDQLRRLGDAHEVELDRGPNRNDLALSHDGRFAAALRRHKAKRPEWSVELIDLETGDRRLIAGSLDTPVRARMHMLTGARLLLESGSGRGYVVDLGQATPLSRREHADPDGRLALELARTTEHPYIELPKELESRARWTPEGDVVEAHEVDLKLDDPGLRMHASVVGRTRVGISALGKLELVTLPD